MWDNGLFLPKCQTYLFIVSIVLTFQNAPAYTTWADTSLHILVNSYILNWRSLKWKDKKCWWTNLLSHLAVARNFPREKGSVWGKSRDPRDPDFSRSPRSVFFSFASSEIRRGWVARDPTERIRSYHNAPKILDLKWSLNSLHQFQKKNNQWA